MSDGPLSIQYDLSQAKTAFPISQDGIYAKWRAVKVATELRDVKDPSQGLIENGKGKVLKIDFDLVEPVPDTDGAQILPGKPGSKLFKTINLYSKVDSKDPSWFVKSIAGLVDALLGTADSDNKKGKPPRPPLDISAPDFDSQLSALILGQVLVAQMRVNTFEGNTRSEFGKIHFPADLAV